MRQTNQRTEFGLVEFWTYDGILGQGRVATRFCIHAKLMFSGIFALLSRCCTASLTNKSWVPWSSHGTVCMGNHTGHQSATRPTPSEASCILWSPPFPRHICCTMLIVVILTYKKMKMKSKWQSIIFMALNSKCILLMNSGQILVIFPQKKKLPLSFKHDV